MASFDLVVVGGGAAGFYGAIQAAEIYGGLKVIILEKSGKLLSKVRISGGGRCNVTHHCFDPVAFSRHYPRGGRPLRGILKKYGPLHTVEWFASQGVRLKVEEDGRMFPTSDRSQTIIDCLLARAATLGIDVKAGVGVDKIEVQRDGFQVITTSGRIYSCRKVLVATGGSPKRDAYAFIEELGHTIKTPVPSLFTFNDPGKKFVDLMGISVPNAEVRIAGTKFRNTGPLLITHWGLSGPAVIRLSAWAAEFLHGAQYKFTALVSWIGPAQEETLRSYLEQLKKEKGKQKVYTKPMFELPQRLWIRLCELSEIAPDKVWGDLSQKHLNRLLEHLIKCPFQIQGKTTFKEEFVTCGGVPTTEVDMETLESKRVRGVFFAGEVLDIDGETGGFNFQAAWSTAYVAAKSSFPT